MSGVGNGINTFALAEACRMPLALLVTMWGEFAEYIQLQIPLGKRIPDVLGFMGFDVHRADSADEVGDVVSGALARGRHSSRAIVVLLGQRTIGHKNWAM